MKWLGVALIFVLVLPLFYADGISIKKIEKPAESIVEPDNKPFADVSSGSVIADLKKDEFSPVKSLLENETLLKGEEEGSGAVYYFLLNDQIVGSVEDGEVSYYHKDRLGSNVVVTKDDEVFSRSKTWVFGQELINPDHEFTFTGKMLDSSGLYYFGARYYDPDLGRFISPDPVEGEQTYVYAKNNPLKFVDPDGRTAIYASNIKERASPFIDFMAKYSYSVREIKETDYVIRYAQVDDLFGSMRMYGVDPVTNEGVQGKWGYTTSLMEVFLRNGQNDVRLFHTLAHESMHVYSLIKDKDLVMARHSDTLYALVDELRTELKLKYEFGLDGDYNEEKWEEIGFSGEDFSKLRWINDVQIRGYLILLYDEVGSESINYFEALDEHIRTSMENGKEVY